MGDSAFDKVSELVTEERPAKSEESRLTVVLDWIVCLAWFLFGVVILGSAMTGDERHVVLFITHTFAPYILIGGLVGAIPLCVALVRGRPRAIPMVCSVSIVLAAASLSTLLGYERVGFSAASASHNSAQRSFTVMDANLLGFRNVEDGFLDEVERLKPDIITLQELNEEVAQRLLERVGREYPCQILAAQPGSQGMGVVARHPCVEHRGDVGELWTGFPQVVEVTFSDTAKVLVANIHTIPPHALMPSGDDAGVIARLSSIVTIREEEIESLLRYLATFQGGSILIAGDLNATPRSSVYSRLRDAGYGDAWAIGSPFAGGTWPHSTWPLLSWLFRIDYVFHSSDLEVRRVAVLKDSFGSDHRGIVAEVAVRPTTPIHGESRKDSQG